MGASLKFHIKQQFYFSSVIFVAQLIRMLLFLFYFYNFIGFIYLFAWYSIYFWQVRVLLSLFPPFLVENFQKLIAPIGGGKIAAMMVGKLDTHTNIHMQAHPPIHTHI